MHWARPPIFHFLPSFLPSFLPFFLPSSAASAVIDATINLTSCSRRQLRNSQPLGGHLTTLITFARSQFAQLLEWEITYSRSQSDLVTYKGCSSFFCLCPSTISFVAAVCRQHAATSCHWTAKSGGIGLYNRRRISQQQRSFSVANNDNWVSSSSSTSMRTMGCPGSVSDQLTGCAVHTPSILIPFYFSLSFLLFHCLKCCPAHNSYCVVTTQKTLMLCWPRLIVAGNLTNGQYYYCDW